MRAARPATALLISAVLALGAAGCGGSEVEYDEVPGPPASVPIPNDTSTLEGSGDSSASGDASATPTPEATAAPDSQSGDAGTNTAATTEPAAPTTDGTTDTGATTDSGGSTAPAEQDGPSNDTAPPAGSEAEQFEAFCAENPGAC